MFRHGATCPSGPVSRARVWWIKSAVEVETAESLSPAASAPGEDVRHDLVARVRREIAEGTYDTPEKWETAVARLLNRLE